MATAKILTYAQPPLVTFSEMPEDSYGVIRVSTFSEDQVSNSEYVGMIVHKQQNDKVSGIGWKRAAWWTGIGNVGNLIKVELLPKGTKIEITV